MRNKSLDAAKAVAACLVVCIHVSFPGQAGQLIKVLARCAVPFFFMVSGYFCYYENENVEKKILFKILHILKLFAASAAFYFIWECFMKVWDGESLWSWIKEIVSTVHLKELLVYNSTSAVRAHLWFLPALIYCYVTDFFIEKWRMRKAAYCCVPALFAILLWRAEFCVLSDGFYHTMEYRNFLFTGMSFFLTGQMIREYQDKITCKCQRKPMRQGICTGMILGVVLSVVEYGFFDAGEIYTGNCVAVICLFLWIILYGKEINFPFVMTETGRRSAFLIYLLHPATADLLKKISELLKISDRQAYLWLRPALVYLLTLLIIYCISVISSVYFKSVHRIRNMV